jgi:hypothetical protein
MENPGDRQLGLFFREPTQGVAKSSSFRRKALGTDNSNSHKLLLGAVTFELWHPEIGLAVRGNGGRDNVVLAVKAETASSSTGNASSLVTEEPGKTWGQTTRVPTSQFSEPRHPSPSIRRSAGPSTGNSVTPVD